MSNANATNWVRQEWLRRVEAEYRSAALTHHLTHWLIQIGASPDLIHSGLRIVGDEVEHAALSHAVYVDAGGTDAPKIDRDGLVLHRTPHAPIERDLFLIAVDMFCFGETVAVRLFHRMRRGCEVPSARTALDRILKDEVFHRDFGWTLLEYFLSTPLEQEYRGLLAGHLGGMLSRIRGSYGEGARSDENFGESERKWGLIPRSEYVEAVEETLVRDYRPRFAELRVTL